MGAICGPQGLSNPDMTLRTRSCYFLTKLVKALREGVTTFVDVIVPGVQGTVPFYSCALCVHACNRENGFTRFALEGGGFIRF